MKETVGTQIFVDSGAAESSTKKKRSKIEHCLWCSAVAQFTSWSSHARVTHRSHSPLASALSGTTAIRRWSMRFNAEQNKKRISKLLERFERASGAQKLDIHDLLHIEISQLDEHQAEQVVARFNEEYDSYSFLDTRKIRLTRATLLSYAGAVRGIQFGGRHSVYVPLANRIVDPEHSAIEACRRMLASLLCVDA
jgi:hypothetical protein